LTIAAVIAVIVECPLPVRAARRSVDAGKPKSTRRFYIWVKRRVIAKTAFAWAIRAVVDIAAG
jgi:hypothetical protein